MAELLSSHGGVGPATVRNMCSDAAEVAAKVFSTLSDDVLQRLRLSMRCLAHPQVAIGQRLTERDIFRDCNAALEQIEFNRSEPVEPRFLGGGSAGFVARAEVPTTFFSDRIAEEKGTPTAP